MRAFSRFLAAPRTRHAGALFAVCIAIAILLDSVHKHYPIQHWIFWRYIGYWFAAGTLSLACLSIGHVSLRLILGRSLPLLEQVAVGFALGLFEFQLLLFLTGLLQLYGSVLFFALPLAMLAVGALPLWRMLRRARRHLRARGTFSRAPGALGWLAIAYGALCLVAIYLPTMTPENLSYDASWRHLMQAEQYAVHGGLRRFPEGWVFAGSPQFTVLLYTWGFMLPSKTLFDHVELCAHLEGMVFLWTTLTGIPAVVRRLVPRANPVIAWVARFLFPGVLLYDSNLSGGADHIGAIFAAPLFVVALRAWRSMDVRTCALLGSFIAAAVCAKETTALLLAPGPVLTVVVRFAIDAAGLVRHRAAGLIRMRGAIVAGATTIVMTAPHWLKNLVWYGDPLYPNLHAFFRGRPWDPDMSYVFTWAFRQLLWSAPRTLAGLTETLHALVTFSFIPRAWWSMHRNVPVFGSLFTLLLLALPFMRGTRRLWMLVAWVHVAIFAWYWVHHEERHLQVLVPWMAAAVAAILVLLWRTRSTALRLATGALVAAQVVWGSDIYFYPTHLTVLDAPIKAAADLLGKGFEGKYHERLQYFVDQRKIGRAVPKRAVLLVNERRDHLGFRRTTVTDSYPDQYGINYSRLATPDRVYTRFRQLGVTHLAWRDHTRGFQPLAGDIVFFEFATRYTVDRKRASASTVGAMPPRKPARPAGPRNVAVLGCGPAFDRGIYELSDLRVPRFGPLSVVFPKPRARLGSESGWASKVFAVAVDTDCPDRLGASARRKFEHVATRTGEWGRPHEIWLRL